MNNEETQSALRRFYDAFASRDGETMASMYGPESTFEDPVFKLKGADIGKMWIGLTQRSKDFSLSYTIAQAGNGRGVVEWTARYLFGGKRPVVNVILSEIEFENGKIARQVDRFDFPRWASQALGLAGSLLGRFEWFRRKVSRQGAAGLGVPPKP